MARWFMQFLCGSVMCASALVGPAAAGPPAERPLVVALGGAPIDPDAPCIREGYCNVACTSDPDCPENLPDPSSATRRPSDIEACTKVETAEIADAIGWGTENWDEFERDLEAFRDWPVDIKSCLQERFQNNGKVVCEATSTGECAPVSGVPVNGWGSTLGLSHRCHMCPAFLNTVRALTGVENREACYFALVTHEWGHTCHRGHKTLEIIDNSAFNFWKKKHPSVTITYAQCGGG
jgi:hypothetical protein